MTLRIVGAGLPRTATMSLKVGLESLLGGPCYHMTAIPGFPFNLGDDWAKAFAGGEPDWKKVFHGFHAAVDWPASLFWPSVHKAFPDALVLLSVRDSAEVWHESLDSTILSLMARPLPPEVKVTTPPGRMFEIFTKQKVWKDPALLKASYDRHNDHVRKTVPKGRLLEWHAKEGWGPICKALKLPVPAIPFPHVNKREEWGLGGPPGMPGRGSTAPTH
ncbi:MAG TPA: sulfotransferase [Planctomycetota bacterium]|nr:sulfotransferase [Planctomycetota bacterium]